MLVDKEGTIVYKGHPAKRKLEEDIDALLKDEKIIVESTPAEKPPAEMPVGLSASDTESDAAKDIFK